MRFTLEALSMRVPASAHLMSEPPTRSRTVLDTRLWDGLRGDHQVEPMDPEDRAQSSISQIGQNDSRTRMDVLGRFVAEQQPLADEESPFTITYTPGMDREPPFAAVILHRGSDRRPQGLNAG
jgi:hypothetical protein